MNVNIICIGKLKEKYWTEAVSEYSKRLKSYCKLTIIELKEERTPDNPSKTEIEMTINSEGKSILHAISPKSFTIALAIEGKEMSSEKMSKMIEKLGVDGESEINFIIGGSFGLSDEVLNHSDFMLSFSPMTFPHQMMRVILLEQIYRSYKIMRNETYHK